MHGTGIISVFLALAVVSFIYAKILPHWRDWYSPNHTWITVVVGNGFVIIAQVIIAWLVGLSFGLLVLLLLAPWPVAGACIIAWQIDDWQRRERESADRQREREGRHMEDLYAATES